MEKNEEKKIVYMECDHCKQKISHLEMYFFQTHNPKIYNEYHHLCRTCYEVCMHTSINGVSHD